MTFYALGINHQTASVEVRERLAFDSDLVGTALREAQASGLVEEIVILSTCNRTEMYCASSAGTEVLLKWLAEFKGIDADEVMSAFYCYTEEQAARHMMMVASGLDSLVLGEPQIFGQMKSAYGTAADANTLGSNLHGLFQQVFSAAKRVRSETAIGENAVSVAYAAVSLAQQIFSNLAEDTALLVGAGETIQLVARHLKERGIKKILVANRTLERGAALAAEIGGETLLLSQIPEYLPRADIVITSTASPLPIIGKGMVEQALRVRKHKPMLIVDIAVPRDVEPQVEQLSDVFLYTVDDLKEVIDAGMRSREQAASLARDIIEEEVRTFSAEQRALSAVATIKQFRTQIGELVDSELAKAKQQLDKGQDARVALERFAHSLSNKFMHEPTRALKAAGRENDGELLTALRRLFALSDDD